MQNEFLRWGAHAQEYYLSDDLEAICTILEDEIKKNQLADKFIISCIEDVRKKRNRTNKLQICAAKH